MLNYSLRSIPGPKRDIISNLRNLWQLQTDRLGFFESLTNQFGEIVGLPLLGREVVLLNNPDFIRHVLVTNRDNYIKADHLDISKRLLGMGLLTSEGELHKRQRQILRPAFHRKHISTVAPMMVDLASKHISEWERGSKLDVYDEMMKLSMLIVVKALFGLDFSSYTSAIAEVAHFLARDFGQLAVSPLAQLYALLGWPFNRKREQHVKNIESIIHKTIEERLSIPEIRNDMLSFLLNPKYDRTEVHLSKQQIRDEVMTLFIAGHETTANALTWTLYLISQHPNIAAKIRKEAQEILNHRHPTFEDIPKLRYTQMVIAESLRLFPPAYSQRRIVLKSDQIGKYHISAGSTVLISQWLMHRNPIYWDAPEEVRPERFDFQARNETHDHCVYFPFGVGHRRCIGEPFARAELTLLVTMLVQAFNFELSTNQLVKPLASVTLRPTNGLPMKLEGP